MLNLHVDIILHIYQRSRNLPHTIPSSHATVKVKQNLKKLINHDTIADFHVPDTFYL